MIKKLLYIILAGLITLLAQANDNVVNVYNWSDYMPPQVLKEFEKETGIKVNYSEYDSLETMYAKLKADPTVSYDVIVPSGYFIDKMRKQNMLQQLDKSQLSNFKNLNPALLHQPYDRNSDYSVPYLWGTLGIAVNKKYIDPNTIKRWSDLWRPEYRDKILLLNDVRMIFAASLISLGYSINDTDPKHIQQAYEKLKDLLPNVKLFSSDSANNLFIDEDVVLGINYSGDTFKVMAENPNIVYIYPEDGFPIWIDNLAIPKGAPHLTNAYKFINFILRPDIAKQIIEGLHYSSANLTAEKSMPLSWRNDPLINPGAKILKRGQTQIDLGTTDAIYAKYWEMLKMGG